MKKVWFYSLFSVINENLGGILPEGRTGMGIKKGLR